jgi:hypothetical protein
MTDSIFRKDWYSGALKTLQETELVLFDPDNGLEIPSKTRHRAGGSKYVWYNKLEPFLHSGKSIVVYQHSNHQKGGAEEAIKRRTSGLRDKLKCGRIWATRWHRFQSRVYFLIPTAVHNARMEKAIDQLQASPWCQGDHFSVIKF